MTIGETLEGKQHTIVTTRQALEDRGNEEMEVLSSNHIFVEKEKEVPQLKDAQEALESFEKENQGMIDELKRVNLGTE